MSNKTGKNKSDPYNAEMRNIKQQIDTHFPTEIVEKLKRISYEISEVGFSEKEACTMADFPYERLVKLKSDHPIISRLMTMNRLQYERDILKNINKKAKKDDKLGKWLLERTKPEKYNPRKGGGKKGGGNEDMFDAAMEYVLSNDEMPVNDEAGKQFAVKRSGNKDGEFNLDELLG